MRRGNRLIVASSLFVLCLPGCEAHGSDEVSVEAVIEQQESAEVVEAAEAAVDDGQAAEVVEAAEAARIEAPAGFVGIPGGTFLMGSNEEEEGRQANEGPQREVTITRSFAMKQTPTTVEEWEEVMGFRPPENTCAECPVVRVNFFDAVAYVNALSEREGLTACYRMDDCQGSVQGESHVCQGVFLESLDCEGFRLPTEAEWEYAVRAGSTEPRYGEIEEIAWNYTTLRGASGRHAVQPVRGKAANEWGLYDTLGNVREWTWDSMGRYMPNEVVDPIGRGGIVTRTTRGCNFQDVDWRCRAANREGGPSNFRSPSVGIRPVRTLE